MKYSLDFPKQKYTIMLANLAIMTNYKKKSNNDSKCYRP